MSSDEVRFAEAVAALTARLEAWAVEDPHDKAHQFLADMRRNGWRPNAPSVYVEPSRLSTPAPADLVQAARDQIAAARTAAQANDPRRVKPAEPEETTSE